MVDKLPSFASKPDDPKDVASGLATAAASWKRGDPSDALRWLRKAVEAASEAEADERALELAKIAADLTTQIGSMAPPPRPSAPPPRPSATPPRPSAPPPGIASSPSRPTLPTSVPRVPPAAVRLPPAPVAKAAFPKGPAPASSPTATTNERPTIAQAPSKETLKKAERRSVTNEGPRKRSASRADRAEVARRPSRTDEIDQWPTDVLAGTDLPPGLGAENVKTKDKGAAVRATQAVRVLVWREADGTVHTVAVGGEQKAPSHAIEATLAALDPDADLLALLG